MNEKADIMIKNIKTKMRSQSSIEIQKFITLCALDINVETAMGAVSDLQSAGDNDYVNAIYSGKHFRQFCRYLTAVLTAESLVMAIVQVRQKSVWLWPDLVFQMTQDGKQFEKDLKILHDFTRYDSYRNYRRGFSYDKY